VIRSLPERAALVAGLLATNLSVASIIERRTKNRFASARPQNKPLVY
jgi:hypothetical protein